MIEELEIVNIEKVKSCTKKTRVMYDLQTKKNHNFFANGILVHNSGTAYRDDGDDLKINAVVGFKSYDLGSARLIEEGWLMRPQVLFIKKFMTRQEVSLIENELGEMRINPTKDYARYYKAFISNNPIRNNVIFDVVNGYRGKKILILVKLVEHGEFLESQIGGSRYLHGSTPKKERDQMFEDFVNGDLNVLISTISIFAEGIDVPSLDVVINAAANKGSVKTIQVLGRVLRRMDGKKSARYIDFMDDAPFFRQASMKRGKALRHEEHDVKTIEWETLRTGF